MSPATIWTIGHSNHELSHFLDMLIENDIGAIADVRLIPASRRHPQFKHDSLAASLAEVGIGYRHFPNLGGRRRKRLPNSPNTAWRVESFNAYADHMCSDEFRNALEQLEVLAAAQPTAMMCAEALPWRCHRRLIADALLAKGWKVFDIFSAASVKEHQLTAFARVVADGVIYPDPDRPLLADIE